ncbi:MAG: hypothetical protein JF628_06705 [Sphingomonas sp.]|jgi:hypothetical protein|nr:hypothetical protein [Sphingomonas sp.]MBW8844147.1 TetR family transcriptional regulator [Burkholderiales bacterium]
MSEELTTRKKLTLAFARLKRDAAKAGKPGPSISAVAREAGVSHTLVHTKYPDIADQIREVSGRGPKQQLEKQRTAAKRSEDRAAELRAELADLKVQNRGLASENARLLLLVQSLEQKVTALQSGSKVVQLKPMRRPN